MRKGHHSQRKGGAAGSILSIGSSGSILSIGSSGSILSVGSAGSILSVGSAGSLGSAFSVGSFASAGSVLSGLSCLSVLAWRSWRRVGVSRRGPGQPGAELRPAAQRLTRAPKKPARTGAITSGGALWS
jgi:hypothetical protein